MSNARYRADEWARRYDPHISPINRFIDELGEHDQAGHPPYVAPMYRGIEAPALAILRDPGPRPAELPVQGS
jgi:hypothetical protein